jgi:hypothetical protein
MRTIGSIAFVAAMALAGSWLDARGQAASAEASAVERAVAYLRIEVPRWRREHPCYSCHNNGDAARALIAASKAGHDVGDSIDDTLVWLAAPSRWASNAMRGGSEDLPLARIQFASALAGMVAAGRSTPDVLDQAAALLVGHQREDGSWRLSESQIVGGATFYGTSLATAMARRSLGAARSAAISQPRARASEWLRAVAVASVLDASSVLLGLEREIDAEAATQRRTALDVLKRGQGPDGGWGPYVNSQSEPFDTALALLALAEVADPAAPEPFTPAELGEAVRKGRSFLIAAQNADGSWPETTRPPGGESYAQRISTTGWSLLALLASD